MSELVIREVTNGVWTFSKPFSRFGFWPIGGRSTAVKLSNGGVWLLASTPLDTETKAKLDELGPVQYIIGADAVHRMFLGDFKRAYPDAKVIAPQDAITGHMDKELKFDGAWGKDPAGTKYGFEDDVEHLYFSGFKNKDVAFLHKGSKSLIQADLLMNLPCTEQYAKSKASNKIFGLFGGPRTNSWLYPRFITALGVDKEAMRRDAKTVSGWDFDRIIPCHGDVVETDAKKTWDTVYQFFLN